VVHRPRRNRAEPASSVDLDMRVRLVDGDEVIADTDAQGGFLAACAEFEAYIQGRFKK